MPNLQDLDRRLRSGFFCHEGRVVVCLDGDLDVTSLADAYVALELAAATHPQVTVDCSGVQYADAAGFRFLISAREQAQASGGDLIAEAPVTLLHRLAEVIGQPSLVSVRDGDAYGTPCSHVLDPAATCQAALAAAVRISGASKGNLQLLDPPTGELRIVAHQGFDQPFLDYFETVRDTGSACGTALTLGTPMWVDDIANSQAFASDEARQVVIDAGLRAVASLPVRAPSDEIIAMLSVHHDRPVEWPRWRQHQLEQVAQLTGDLASQAAPAA